MESQSTPTATATIKSRAVTEARNSEMPRAGKTGGCRCIASGDLMAIDPCG
jgi:hypothetical protein